jgi:hypothetical protein
MYIETTHALGAGTSNFYPFIPEGYEPITRDDPRWVEPQVFISDVGSTTPAFATAVYAPIPNYVAPSQPPVEYPTSIEPYQPPDSIPEPQITIDKSNYDIMQYQLRYARENIVMLENMVKECQSKSNLNNVQSTTYVTPVTSPQPDNSIQASWSSLFGTTRTMSKYLI